LKRLESALLLALAAWPVAARSQVEAAPAESVVVTGTRVERRPFDVPASVDRIGGDALRDDRLAVNLTETLGLLPGVTARDRQNFAQDVQISIRGFGTRASFGIRGVRVIVDGIPATLPDGQGQLSHIELAAADRVEVLRGPFSALYGNSSGGVLQVFSAEGSGAPSFDAALAGGSNHLVRSSLRAAGSEGRLGYAASLTHVETDGPREHSAARRDTGNLKLKLHLDDDQSLQLVANRMALDAQDPLGLTRAQFDADPHGADTAALRFDTRKTADQVQAGLQWQRRLGAQQSLQWLVYTGQRHTEQFQAIPTAAQGSPLHPGGVIQLDRNYGGSDLRWTLRSTDPQAWNVVAGLSWDTLDEDRRGFQNFVGPTLGIEGALRRDEHNRVLSLDPYVQASLQLASAWRLDAGVRRSTVRVDSSDRFIHPPNGDDSGSTRFSAITPVLGLLFSASERLHLYASYGRGFETPTLNELAYRPDGSAGLNLALRASHSDNAEIGAKWHLDATQSVQLALFETRAHDELVTQTNSGGRATYRNATSTLRRGVEAGWQGAWHDWRAQAAATLLDATYRNAFNQCAGTPCTTPTQAIPAGQRLPGIAKGTAALALDWAPPQGWRGGLELRYSSRVPVNDAGTDAAAAYTVAALHGGYRLQLGRATLRAFARIDNLFDRAYAGSVIVNESNGRYFEPAPGRSAFAGFDVSFAL
jgi:iron complex outermembrane receptor protein